ncbi:MAG TPA: hypothetical protein VIY73_13665 [Polyangiaceae bacterium]
MNEPQPRTNETQGTQGKTHKPQAIAPKPDPEKTALVDRRARTREQLGILTAASWCSRPHGLRLPRPNARGILAERMAGGEVYEGAADCAECQRKLAPMAAALLLVVLPPVPSERLLQAAKELRMSQPMTWAAVERQNPVQVAQAIARTGAEAFSANEYQSMASDLLALARSPE